MSRILHTGVVTRVDLGDAQAAQPIVIKRIRPPGFLAILHLQITVTTQRVQTFVHDALALFKGRLSVQYKSTGRGQCGEARIPLANARGSETLTLSRDRQESVVKSQLHGFLLNTSGVSPELIL